MYRLVSITLHYYRKSKFNINAVCAILLSHSVMIECSSFNSYTLNWIPIWARSQGNKCKMQSIYGAELNGHVTESIKTKEKQYLEREEDQFWNSCWSHWIIKCVRVKPVSSVLFYNHIFIKTIACYRLLLITVDLVNR